MNFENTLNKTPNHLPLHTRSISKTAVLSLSILLGACASTGEKQVETAAPEPEKKVEQKEDKTPAPTAAELMKTLKAPLAPPPEEEPVAAKPTKSKPSEAEALKAAQEAEKKAALAAAEAKKSMELAKAAQAKAEAKLAAAKQQVAAKPAPAPVESAPEPQSSSIPGINAKPFNVSASKLPFTYDIWTIRKGNTPLTQGLVIATPTWEMGKEGYTSQIWLTMMEDKIHVNSSSDIEPASKGLGIRIDGGDLIPFSSIEDNNIGVIDGKWLDKLAIANKVDIYLGFFPGKKPTSDTFKSDLSLSNLARMVATYRALK